MALTTHEAPGTMPLGMARRTLGIILLLVVVVLWTTSNFLGSTIFADKTYPNPFFVTYTNTSMFMMPLILIVARRTWALWRHGKLSQITSLRSFLNHLDSHDPKAEEERILRSGSDEEDGQFSRGRQDPSSGKLGLKATAKLSIQFCLLWFTANYFAMGCLQFTSVASTTILTSTSGVWTMVFGALLRVEKFTMRKLMGVLASLIGIILISRVDLSKPETGEGADSGEGSFPHKSSGEIALGDAMAAFSAILYGLYTVVMKKQVGDESRVNMPLFFGLVGFFNIIFLWPGFFIMHWTGLEPFSLPETSRVWSIILTNAFASFVSDIAWAYSMLLTTPLIVTVGLSMTIPLSLIGQMVLQSQYSSPLYWVGAAIVFLSFLVVQHESKPEDDLTTDAGRTFSGEYNSIPVEEEEMR
ncbi:hypothetical protein DTO013E5_655 [Penicillium roqueforti]|uniref:Drug/metabolite transporter n=1 Tax=Penicillium roqueforti (strain FM164) TaxID=1365484 RepID=W6Q904_PENRF|nr:hypothetical protein CBS147337_197 [Penicillium roqueforti]CDM30699.1 Drug/metabolite transporter [Penicillium roqueforti FM164]KAI2680609.1 hypothetical protein CBS147355_3589 [Penicillium roqueforti]KAI2691002.1 hypothetical protein LCP963914a_1203 [Penicillium roqueforti]KAI2707033.1 hypothetical protein CBS147372_944 [Penicillium roqueforti]